MLVGDKNVHHGIEGEYVMGLQAYIFQIKDSDANLRRMVAAQISVDHEVDILHSGNSPLKSIRRIDFKTWHYEQYALENVKCTRRTHVGTSMLPNR